MTLFLVGQQGATPLVEGEEEAIFILQEGVERDPSRDPRGTRFHSDQSKEASQHRAFNTVLSAKAFLPHGF